MTTIVLYMLFALFDYQGGIANFIGLTVLQPIFAILLSVVTVIVCGLVGLPVRLNRKLNEWWKTHFYVSILIGLSGLIACAISLTPGFVEEITYSMDGAERTHMVPNQVLSITGWFLVAFGTLHVYPPKFFKTTPIMRPGLSILISMFLISCSEFGADKPEEKEQTIELSYIAWACDCANWATQEDIRKYHDNFGDTLADLSIYIEPINESMALPDTLGYSGDVIKFTGHFYKEKGFPKGYHSFEDPDKARVFRYRTYHVIKSNYKSNNEPLYRH